MPINCKACNSSSVVELPLTRTLTRPDFRDLKLQFHKCKDCDLLFTDGFDLLNEKGWERFYAYPEYLKYDPAALTGRRDERTYVTVQHVQERFEMGKRPKVLMHGNGTCNAFLRMWAQGYDVYATHAPYTFDNCITVEQAMEMGDFDIVCAIEVLEHFAFPNSEFVNVNRILKKGGVFCGTTCLNDGIPLEQMKRDEWHYLKQHTINAGHCTIWSARAFDAMCEKLAWKNMTEHGSEELRKVSHMPSTSVFFQFQK